MAETRKHRIEVRDELDKALLAALGQSVRPAEPGSQVAPGQTSEAEPTAPETPRPHTAPFVTRGSAMGGFTFEPKKPKQG